MNAKILRRSLAVLLTLAMLFAMMPNVLAADYSGWTSFAADFSQPGHDILHKAMGCLYGIGEEDVPTTNILTPLNPYTFEQKAPDGLQHPTGDAVFTAPTFIESGGDWIQVGCPDIKAGWYYEDSPFASSANYELYKSQLADQARKCVEAGLSGKCVYNIFNETDGNGGSWNTATATWCAAWKDFVETIRAIDPEARFSGPGYANFNGTFIRDWLQYCVENDCVPFQITLHDLFDDRYNSMESEISSIRTSCAQVGLTDYEICVNEYGQYENLGNPAGLLKYVATLEDNEASGCLAFWNVGNSLDDLAADANEPNGAWWMYKIYADMTGKTVKCTSSTNKIALYGLATIDEQKGVASALFGGSYKGNEVLKMQNLNKTETFKGASYALVTLRSTAYSGTYGPAEEPALLYRRVLPIENGTVYVPVEGASAFAVYYATAVPVDAATDPAEAEGAWRAVYEGESATRAGGASTVSSNTRYPASNGSLGTLPSTSASLSFRVTVPTDGYYEIRTVYGMDTGSNPGNMNNHNPRLGKLDFTVDSEAPVTVDLDNTMLQLTCDNFVLYPYLSAGEHTIKLQPNSATTGYPVVDCMYVSYYGTDAYSFNKTLEAEEATFNVLHGVKSTPVRLGRENGVSFVSGLAPKVYMGCGVRFSATVPENGMYNVKLHYRSKTDETFGLYLRNTALTLSNKVTDVAAPKSDAWSDVSTTLYLEKGMNLIDVDASSADVCLDYINLTPCETSKVTTVIEAEDAKLSGNAASASNSYASGGKYIRGLEGKADGSNALTFTYNAEKAGKYQLDLYYSSSELFGNHGTNVAMVDRYFTMSVNGGRAKNLYCRCTYSADCFRVKTVTVQLKQGENVIKLWNDDHREYRRDRGGPTLLDNFAPNLDKIGISPISLNVLAAAHTHDTVLQDAKAATCLSAGYSGDEVCQLCGEIVSYGKELPATGHKLVHHEAKAPGCLIEGWKAYDTCENCYYTTYEAVAPKGHTFDEGKVTVEPTQTTAGVRTFTCVDCGATKTKRISPLGQKVPESIDFTDADSADLFEIAEKSSAAIRAGQGLYLVSTTDAFEPCNGQISTFAPKDVVKIPAEGDWIATAKIKFDQGGSPGYYEFFGFYAMDDYDNCVGIRAGDGAMQDFIRKGGNVTADTDGVKTSAGLKSASTHWLRIAKDGDNYVCYWSTDGVNFSEIFSYADTGITGDILCLDAYSGMSTGYNYTIESLTFEEPDGPACEHDYKGTVTAPTCTEKGYTTYTCSKCGDSYKDDEVAALGHDYKDGICTRCGEKDPEYVPPVEPKACPSEAFPDAPAKGNWAHEGIDYCIANEYMNGTGNGLFSPDGDVTRAQLVTILYRIEGEPETAFKGTFADVEDGLWYSKAIEWAAAGGIVNGVGEGRFDPTGVITREQIATIFFRYAKAAEGEGSIESFPDCSDAHEFAVPALGWATQKGIINGVSTEGVTYLKPLANASRAQIASIIMRYLEGEYKCGE